MSLCAHTAPNRPDYDSGLDEPTTDLYRCPTCGAEKEVSVTYDLFSKMFFPDRFKDTVCGECDEYMEKEIHS